MCYYDNPSRASQSSRKDRVLLTKEGAADIFRNLIARFGGLREMR